MPIGLKIKKLLKENQQGGHIVPPPSRNRVKAKLKKACAKSIVKYK